MDDETKASRYVRVEPDTTRGGAWLVIGTLRTWHGNIDDAREVADATGRAIVAATRERDEELARLRAAARKLLALGVVTDHGDSVVYRFHCAACNSFGFRESHTDDCYVPVLRDALAAPGGPMSAVATTCDDRSIQRKRRKHSRSRQVRCPICAPLRCAEATP